MQQRKKGGRLTLMYQVCMIAFAFRKGLVIQAGTGLSMLSTCSGG